MAECACETRTYARGLKSIVAKFVEDLIYNELKTTVCIGVALLTPKMLNAGALVRAAAAALYTAKHSGKNTVVVAD